MIFIYKTFLLHVFQQDCAATLQPKVDTSKLSFWSLGSPDSLIVKMTKKPYKSLWEVVLEAYMTICSQNLKGPLS